MRLSIEPIGPHFRDSLKAHLAAFGLSGDVVEWKYFRRPWHGAPTGFVWVKGGMVKGAVGLIPFEIRTGNAKLNAAWTCDWVVDSPQTNPGVGVMLLQHAKAAAGPLFSLGGNDLNRQLMPRIATWWHDAAALELHLPLRAGGSRWFRGIDRRVGGVLGPLQGVPVRRFRPVKNAIVVAGISAAIEDLLEGHPSLEAAAPAYTLDYLRWQLQLAPGVECMTIHEDQSRPRAAAVCWSRASAPGDWRVALWAFDDDEDGSAGDVLQAAMSQVDVQGGQRLSILVSGFDSRRIALLQRFGFRADGDARPLFVSGAAAEEVKRLRGLSFVDTDLAYRL